MSMLQAPPLYKDHFKQGHSRSRSYNEIMSQFKSITQASFPSINRNNYVKKRSYSDLIDDSGPTLSKDDFEVSKRSKTAPPTERLKPVNTPEIHSLRSRSLSPRKSHYPELNNHASISPSYSPLNGFESDDAHQVNPGKSVSKSDPSNAAKQKINHENYDNAPHSPGKSPQSPNPSNLPKPSNSQKSAGHTKCSKIKLPSLADALNNSLKYDGPIAPTVSLDYFDTYKPNDENWRYEVLDSINKNSKNFNIDRYNYLNKTSPSIPSTASSFKISKPNFNSKMSSKILSAWDKNCNNRQNHRKINFPYESNYTYLNKTYLHDVEKYPEYLELAHSLIQLSQTNPQQQVQLPSINQASTGGSTTGTSSIRVERQNSLDSNYDEVPIPIPRPTNVQGNYARAHFNDSDNENNLPYMTAIMPSPPLIASNRGHLEYSSKKYYNTSHIENGNYHTVTPTYHMAVSPIASALPPQTPQNHVFAATNFNPYLSMLNKIPPSTPQRELKTTPPTPPSSKTKARSDLVKSPTRASQQNTRVCISCGSDQSPCWRPSWSIKEGQLCNSCGLRYKKTSARCLNSECKKIPAKGEWSLMQSKGKIRFDDGTEGYSCLDCGWRVEVKK